MAEVSSESSKRPRGWRRLFFIMVVAVGGLAVGCGYLFWQYRQALSKQTKTEKERIAAITEHVDAAVTLPGEEPTIATVTDTKKLTEPQLAAQAQNGDELLVYTKAKRVILYRPSTQKIVDMFRVETPPGQTETSSVVPPADATR